MIQWAATKTQWINVLAIHPVSRVYTVLLTLASPYIIHPLYLFTFSLSLSPRLRRINQFDTVLRDVLLYSVIVLG